MLSSADSPLHGICCTRSSGAGTDSRGGLETHVLSLNDLLSDGCRLCRTTLPSRTLATTQASFEIIPHVQRTAEKFRRNVICPREQLVTLLGDRDNRYRISLHFDFQSCLSCDVA